MVQTSLKPISRDPPLVQQINSHIRTACSDTTIHGIPNLVKNTLFFYQFIWIVCLLASFVGCAYLMSQTINGYLNYDVTTQIKTVKTPEVEFPTVSFCNLNFAIDDHDLALIKKIIEREPYINDYLIEQYDFIRYYLSTNLMLYHTNRYAERASIYLNRSVISCYFNQKPCKIDDMFSYYLDSFYGMCFRFNAGKNMNNSDVRILKSTNSGPLNGLQIVLYIHDPGFDWYSMGSKYGLHVYVDNSSVMPDVFTGLDIPANAESSIAVSRTFTHRLPAPYSECVEDLASFDSTFVKFFVNNDLTYTQEDCFVVCL